MYTYAHIKFPPSATGVFISSGRTKPLKRGHYKSVAYQTVSITLLKGVVVVFGRREDFGKASLAVRGLSFKLSIFPQNWHSSTSPL